MPDEFGVYHVPDDAPAKAEAMGTKPKFWFSRDAAMWLFKATRLGQGEHWAEVVAAGLAQMLGLPHAHYELSRWRYSTGVVTPRFTPDGFEAAGRTRSQLPPRGGTLRPHAGAHD